MPLEIQKKCRIQLYDADFNHLSDRLVEQDTELYKGPKETHEGPIKIEVCLFEQSDIEQFVKYLYQLQGSIPMEQRVPGKRGRPKLKDSLNETNQEAFLENLTSSIANGDLTSQEELIEYLREQGFKFLTMDYIQDLGLNFPVEEEHEEGFQWMMPCLKTAKDPANDKFDPKIAFGFRVLGNKKIKKVPVYLFNEVQDVLELPWEKENSYNIHKTDMAKFPPYMTMEERESFRKSLRDMQRDPEMPLPRIIKRWYQDVEFAQKEEIKSRIAGEKD